MTNLMTQPHEPQGLWSAQPQGELTLANFAGSYIAVAANPCSPVMSQLPVNTDIPVNGDRATAQNDNQPIENKGYFKLASNLISKL